jgi:hypothetical protein
MDYVVLAGLSVSLCLNAFLGFRHIKKKHILNVGAKELLAELMTGTAVVRIQVVDTSGLFYRSPKG